MAEARKLVPSGKGSAPQLSIDCCAIASVRTELRVNHIMEQEIGEVLFLDLMWCDNAMLIYSYNLINLHLGNG
jgi:hypothetical protein